MDWKKHSYRAGTHTDVCDDLPLDPAALEKFIAYARARIEPWLSAIFQAEHLNLLLGSGFTSAIASQAGSAATGMGRVQLGTAYDDAIDAHAAASAKRMRRGEPNIEDQFRSALALLEGFRVVDKDAAKGVEDALDSQLRKFLFSLLKTERDILHGTDADKREGAAAFLQSFLLSFASRAASRERLHIFTANYDRLIEHGCDLAGLRIIDRFVGALNPVFRSSRIEVDLHYNPPGIRGEPRFMEGVLRLTKLHGSLDWHYDSEARIIRRLGIPFGAPEDHTDMPKNPIDTVMIYPNPGKDVETTAYPYAELFRDMAAALCRPNAVVVTFGYGFGDDHINRVLLDMLSIPSTHIVIIAYSVNDRIKAFCDSTRDAQVSLLLGSHFGSLNNLVDRYLPKPALDYITGRLTELMKRRPADQNTIITTDDSPALVTTEHGLGNLS
jgi:SIR2-like domain